MHPERESTQLPSPPRRRPRRDWGRIVARIFCVWFAFLGILPLGIVTVARSPWARAWAESETKRLVVEQGMRAGLTYTLDLRLWPLAVELTRVQIGANDGGTPAFAAERIAARPKFFALLSGKLVIEQIELDAPHARLVVRDGKIMNVDMDLPKPTKGGNHAPFDVFAVSDAVLDLDLDGQKLTASEVDVDVTVDDDRDLGSSYEVAVRVSQASFHRSRLMYPKGPDHPEVAVDDDSLCAIDARVRIAPDMVLVRRLDATGSADLDVKPQSTPKCNLPADDKRRVELGLSHLRVRLAQKDGEMPRVDGHVHVRFPLALAERAASLPETDGWMGFDGDVRYAEDTLLPDVTGHFQAHGISVEQKAFAQEIQTDLTLKHNVVTSPLVMVRIGDGVANLTEVQVEPLAKGVPLRARLDAKDVNFSTLLSNLNVAHHTHVAWDLREVHTTVLHGTIVPLNLDGELTAKTANFAVFDAWVKDPAKKRMIGVKEAAVAAHVGVRADALTFSNASALLPSGSKLEGGFVSLAYRSIVKIDVPKGSVDLADLTPLADIPIGGIVDVNAHIFGNFSDPHLVADTSIQNFVLGDIPFGNVTAAHLTLTGLVVDLTGVKAMKGKSDYEMPTARLDFGGPAGMTMDAVATSTALGVRDFFAIWKMEDDPRFAAIDGSIATRSTLHIALGGPEDVCGGGFIDVRSTTHVKNVSLYGERFDDGDLDLEYKWTDRQAGIEGADVDIRAVTLHKVHPEGVAPLGSLLGSANIQRGGGLHGSVVIEALPLSRLNALGPVAKQIDGSVSGIAQVRGTVDAFTVSSELDVTPIRVRGAVLGSSHLRFGMTQKAPDAVIVGHTPRCKGRIGAPFNKEAYLRDTSSAGDYLLDGDLFGGQVNLAGVTVSRQKSAVVRGAVALRKVDLGAVSKIVGVGAKPPQAADGDDAPVVPELGGELSGDLSIERLTIDDLSLAKVRFAPKALTIERAGQRLALRPSGAVIAMEGDAVNVPPLGFDLVAQNGLKGAFTLRGTVSHLAHDPDLALTAELAPIDLGLLVGVVPKLDRALGALSGSLKVGGHASSPAVDGELKVRGGEFAVHGLPSVISEVEVDVRADASEVRIVRGTARFAGGTVQVPDAHVPIRDLSLGIAEATVIARGIHLAPSDGVSATVDADLTIALNNSASGGARARLPHVTGDVLITSFEYNRAINLLTGLGGFSVGAKRTVVESYDPSLDAVDLDLRVRSRAPLKIKNNLVEVAFGIDSGALTVTGTNQRLGLRGDLKALAGGRFHLFANEFEIRQAFIRFDDATRIAPNVDILAVTEYRRYTDTSAGAAAGAGTTAGSTGAGSGRAGGLWRISLHAFGDADNVRLEMTSDPALAQEDIFFLLTVGLTRSEVDQVQAGSLGASVAFEAVGTATGADRAVKNAIPVIDDFRFGSAYSSRTGRSEPQVTIGRRVTDNVRASVTSGLTEDRELRSNIEWRLNQKLSVQGSYDNINDVSSSAVGNVGVDFRWRLEFE